MRYKEQIFDMEQEMDSLEDFISLIRKRTAMYIGGHTITHLKAFLDGWFFGKEEEIKDSHLLEQFQEWVQKKYRITSSHSWARIISFYSSNEVVALEKFFELFEEFLEQKK